MKRHLPLFVLFLFCYGFFAFPADAHAYLDPGTGSMLLSVIVGLASSAFFAIRKLPTLARNLLFRLRGQTLRLERTPIVMYAESAAYWNTFRPLLEECGRRGVAVQYLTSNEKDPVFEGGLPECITPRFIGTGNTAYTLLNFLEADVFVLTTPGVDVLQIRRSKGVGKYIHVLHAPTDIHIYKIFSFDFYDEILCSGQHQIRSIRALEEARHTKAKRLPLVGCPYYDVLLARREADFVEPTPNCVLLAPTWGRNGMLTRPGSAIPKVLAEAGFDVIVRPHPQSFVSELPLMEALQAELSGYANITWDRAPDGFASMGRAEVLVSDMSGIICDFAFVFLKPVITLDFEFNPNGFEAFDIPHPPWIFGILDDLGRRLKTDEVERLPEIIRAFQADAELAQTFQICDAFLIIHNVFCLKYSILNMLP